MARLKSITKEKLDNKMDDILKDMHEVLIKHGFEDISLTKLKFGPKIPGAPCSPPAGGTWTWVPDGFGGYKLVCRL